MTREEARRAVEERGLGLFYFSPVQSCEGLALTGVYGVEVSGIRNGWSVDLQCKSFACAGLADLEVQLDRALAEDAATRLEHDATEGFDPDAIARPFARDGSIPGRAKGK